LGITSISAASAAAGIAGVPPAPGEFVPAPPMSSTKVDPARSPLPDAVKAYAKQNNVGRERAQLVLVAQSHGTGLEEELRNRLGEGFGGLEFDQEKARFKVWLAPGGSRDTAASVLATRSLDDTALLTTRWSAVAREKAVGALSSRLAAPLKSGAVSLTSTPDRGVVVTRYSDTDDSINATAAEVVNQLGDEVISVHAKDAAPQLPEPQACVNMYCDPPLVAGDAYGYVISSSSWGGCTTAFSASAGSNQYQLTAGHCTSVPNWPSPGRWNNTCYSNGSSCPWIGQDIGGYAGAGGDGGLMSAGGTWYNYPAVHVIGWSWPTYGTPGTGNATVGMYLCHTGLGISATSCGTVTSLTAGGAWGGSAMVEVSGTCTIGGDSGGPWFDPSTMVAIGIHSAGYAGCNQRGYFEPVTRAAATLGVTVQHI
jgi:hypothetical protein